MTATDRQTDEQTCTFMILIYRRKNCSSQSNEKQPITAVTLRQQMPHCWQCISWLPFWVTADINPGKTNHEIQQLYDMHEITNKFLFSFSNFHQGYKFTGFTAFTIKISTLLPRGAQSPGARSPGRLNFVWWHLIFLDPKYGTCLM